MEKHPCLYMLASKPRGVLYVGATSNLVERVWKHRRGFVSSFTRKYRVHRLVYFETSESMIGVLEREYRIKRWRREWKIDLIERDNPRWSDLYEGLLG